MHDPSSTASGRIPSSSGASFHLLPSGASRVDPLCIGIETGADCAIVNRDGVPSRRLFAVGPLARAAFREIIARWLPCLPPKTRNGSSSVSARNRLSW